MQFTPSDWAILSIRLGIGLLVFLVVAYTVLNWSPFLLFCIEYLPVTKESTWGIFITEDFWAFFIQIMFISGGLMVLLGLFIRLGAIVLSINTLLVCLLVIPPWANTFLDINVLIIFFFNLLLLFCLTAIIITNGGNIKIYIANILK